MSQAIEALRTWARDIVLVLVFAGILELALPDGSTRKYVRVVMGLLIMVVVLNPVVSLFKGALPRWESATSYLEEEPVPEALSHQAQEAVIEAFAMQLEEEIESAALSLGASEATAHVEVGQDEKGRWDVMAITLKVKGTFGWGIKPIGQSDLRFYEAQAKEALSEVLRERYGIQPERITVTFITE